MTAMLVLLMSLSQGTMDNLVLAATTLSAGHVNVSGFYKTKPSIAAPMITNVPELKKIVEENTPDLDYVIDRNRGWAKLVSPTASLQTALSGIEISNEDHLLSSLQLAREDEYKEGGRAEVIGDPKRLSEPNTAIIFVAHAKALEVQVGDMITIRSETSRGITNTVDVQIVAIARDVGMMSSWNVFVPKKTILELYQLREDTTGALYIYLKDINKSEEVMAHLRGVFEDKGYTLMDYQPTPFFMKFDTVMSEDWTGQRLDFTTWEDEVSFMSWIITGLDIISITLIAILMVIIAVGITNTMLISVRERTQEIGTLRAIGMSKFQVLLMFMLEALFLGLFATTLGALAGAAIAFSVDAASIEIPVEALRAILLSDTINLSVKVSQVLIAIISLTIFTGLSALWPALRASRLQPVTAIHKTT